MRFALSKYMLVLIAAFIYATLGCETVEDMTATAEITAERKLVTRLASIHMETFAGDYNRLVNTCKRIQRSSALGGLVRRDPRAALEEVYEDVKKLVDNPIIVLLKEDQMQWLLRLDEEMRIRVETAASTRRLLGYCDELVDMRFDILETLQAQATLPPD